VPSTAQQAPVAVGGVNVTVSVGRRVASGLERLLNRFATRVVVSFPRSSQPKAGAEPFTQACTSAARPGPVQL
jgi:hypothetical protein